MAVARITRELAAVDLTCERESRFIPVCAATKDEWGLYLDSVNFTRHEWINGTVYIVRPPSKEDERFAFEFKFSLRRQPAFEAYLESFSLPSQPDLPDYEPDARFGPWVTTGALCPLGVKGSAFWSTLILEVGLSRGWGHDKGLLDWKARHWARVPGVRFILCVAVTERFTSVEYKLHTVERDPLTNPAHRLPDLDPVPVVGPHTMVSFDSRKLLGLPAGADIPPN